MSKHHSLTLLLTSLLFAATAQAGDVFPVKAYTKPDEPIIVKFVNEKTDAGKKIVTTLGEAAAQLDDLFTPVSASDIAAADGTPSFKIISAAGEALKVTNVKPTADGTVDLTAACPKLKEVGTYYLTWKDATPLVIETLPNPGRSPAELERIKARMDQLSADDKKTAMLAFAPVVTHIELAECAVITTDKGVIKAKFSYDVAPHTVDNFVSLARQNFYDGSAFHRILYDFMIQGGDSLANTDQAGQGGPGYNIQHEFSDKKHLRGVLSMARLGAPGGGNDLTPTGSAYYDTAGSQFFIMHGDTPNLDGQYSAFGDVIEGLDVLDDIAKTPADHTSGAVTGPKPKIISIRIVPGTAKIYGLDK